MHNDWKQGVPPAVYVYDDRLEIVSIGGLPKGQTIESFFKGKSVPVNEPMIRLFMKLDLMEQNGHGIPIILKEYGKEVFEIEDNFITVTIPFDRTGFENDAQNDLENVLIKVIKNNPQITRIEMAKHIGKSKATVERILKKSQKIIYVGSSKNGHWEIKE